MRVVAMFRVSTEKQANEGASLDAQERRYRELAQSSGWRTVEVLRGCESATQASNERAVLQKVLACIRSTQPDAIYVHEQSRLTRGDELEVAGLLRELRERQLKVIVGGVVRDLSSLDERFMVGIQSLVDRAEAERIKERHQRGKREKAKKGLKNSGPPPFGYMNPPPGDPNRGVLQIVEAQAATVRRMFALAADGHGTRTIASMLDAEGTTSPRGGQWAKTTIARMLSNPAYRGCHISSGWVAEAGSRTFRFDPSHPAAVSVEGAHEAIVSSDVWHAAQPRKAVPARRPRMLSGLMTMNGLPAVGDSMQQRRFYRPPRGTKGGPWIPAQIADEAVWCAFLKAVSEPRFLEQIVADMQSKKQSGDSERDRESLNAQIARIEARLVRLVDMRADGEIPSAEFRRRSGDARKQVHTARKRLAYLEQAVARADGQWVHTMFSAARMLVASQRAFSYEERRKVLQRVVRHVDVRAERVAHRQSKDKRGRFETVQGSPWKIRSVTFDLASEADDRTGHLATTY